MTVTFLTKRTDHQVQHPQIQVLNLQQVGQWEALLRKSGQTSTEGIDNRLKGWLVLGHDIENRGDPNKGELLLSSFYWGNNHVLVIDNTSIANSEVFTPEILKRCFFIAHNADHEAMWGTATGFMPMRYGCTMVTGKRLYSGMEGYKHDLISELNRWLGNDSIPIYMDKDVRNEFATCEFFTNEHVLYNAADSLKLKAMYEAQLQYADKLGQTFLVNSLCSRIIKPIAWTETKGIKHNTPKWLDIAKERQEKADKVCQELNNMVFSTPGVNMEVVNPALIKERLKLENRRLKEQKRKEKLELQLKNLEEKSKTHLKSYNLLTQQLTKLLQGLNEREELDIQDTINWGSQKQVLKVFEQMSIPLPLGKDKKTHQMKAGVGKEARANWFVAHANTPSEPFMKQFDEFKKLIHNVKSFGPKWVEKYVRDGRVYTRFDQAGTDTGRWTSGSKGKNKIYPNLSQIPKPKEYRQCFMADEDRVIFTCDYRNQEGVLIISLSGDIEMKKITEAKDQHSLLGTKAWRAVYANRAARTGKQEWIDLANTYEMNKSTPEKEKERDKFKNSAGLFPVLYGCNASKVAATAQVTNEEGQIMIDVIKSVAPQAVKFLDGKSKEASSLGYVVHNSRTHSRRYFTKILDNLHYGFPITKSETIEIEMAGRNTAIQGSGSDLMKEAIAMIDCWNNLFKQDIQFVLSNYDEAVYSFPKAKAEQYKDVVIHFMKAAAKNYLIKEVDMDVEFHLCDTWTK